MIRHHAIAAARSRPSVTGVNCMSRADAILSSAVQIAGPLTRLQERIVAVKLHPDAVSVVQLHPSLDSWEMDRLVSWSLDRAIGREPVQENYPYLVDQIAAAADEAGVDGVDAGIAIPGALFDTRVLTLPFMPDEDIAAEAEEPEFWEEFDPELNNLLGRVVKYQVLYSNENEDRTVVLISSIAVSEIERYRGLLLDANLLPVYIENELFSLVNGIYARLSVDDLFKPFAAVYLCPGNNFLIAHMRGRLITHKIPVSDFDEALLKELEGVDDVSGDFWEEVAIRLSEAVKQATSFIHESYDFPKLDKVFLVSEYKVIDNVTALLEERLGTTRIIPYDAMEDVDVPEEHARYVDYFANPSVFTTAVGLATQGLNVEGKDANSQHQRLISMNFLDDAPRIRRNRQLAALNRILSVAIMAVVLVSGGLLGFNSIPAYMQTRDAVRDYETAKGFAQTQTLRRQVNEQKLSDANELTFKLQNNSMQRGHSEFLAALPSMIPATAELESLHIRENNGVELSGVAMSNTVISDIKNNLRTARFTRRDPSVTTARDGELWRFTMNIKLARVD